MASTDTFIAPPFDAALMQALLALNNAHGTELAFESEESFATLFRRASFVRAAPNGLAMLVGFNHLCDYPNPNFAWLKNRFPRFKYIDRVVVDGALRGRGVARSLYAAFEADARAQGLERLVCEINAVPPNPASDQFHLTLGFVPVGEQVLAAKNKTVRYWAKELV